jgi:protein-S-isoprenylcysteine O-methyltransferase Ste14
MIFTFNFLFQISTLLLFFFWWLYWAITERSADREKPKTKRGFHTKQQVRRLSLRVAEIIMILQVIGLQIVPFSSFIMQAVGFIFVFIGVVLSISARKTLGTNWAHAYEYQVKKEQELITSGIYSKIRHPIYSGLCLAFIGGELVAQSYLVIIGFFLLAGGYWQARKEEAILVKHFGNTYRNYIKRSKMFIPYLW